MALENIASLWIRDLEREAYRTHPASEVWTTVRSLLNTERITADGMSMGHLSHKQQLEIQQFAKNLVDQMVTQHPNRIIGIRT